MCNPLKIKGDAEEKYLSLQKVATNPPYSLGGYYHRERLTRTRRINKNTTDGRWEDKIFEPIPPKTFGYSLGGYSHREHWSSTQ
jgi:hypothetical protein